MTQCSQRWNLVAAFCYLLVSRCAFAAEAEPGALELAHSGTAALRAGDVESAVEQLDRAIALGYRAPEVLYNKAIAHYRSQQLDEAADLFAQVAASSKNSLASQARFNLGNLDYSTAIQLAEQDSQAAIAKLRSAIQHYRRALSLDAADADARANIELAGRLMKEFREQQRQQQQTPQQNESSDNPPPNQVHSTEQQPQQENQAASEQNQQQDPEQDQPPNRTEDGQPNPEQEDKPLEQQQDDQAREDDADESQTDSATDQNGDPTQPSDPQEQDTGAATEDADAEDENPTEGELKALNEMDEQQQLSSKLPQGQTMTVEEAQKMLQAIRDREFRRRLQKMQQSRNRRVPVAKDW